MEAILIVAVLLCCVAPIVLIGARRDKNRD